MRDSRMIGCQGAYSGKRCGGGGQRRMPWDGKEEEIMGTGGNHHEMMVATKKGNPVNIIFYFVKVISPVLFR